MPSTDAALQDAIEELADVPLLLVAMDFDGTMSPLVPRPEDARPLPAAAAALEALAELPGTTTAILSGRDLASLRRVASPGPNTLLVGSHGAERWAPEQFHADGSDVVLDDRQLRLLETVRNRLAAVAAACPGAALEAKPAGVVLHVREAAPAAWGPTLAAGRAGLEDLEGVTLKDGKAVLEASVVRADKGSGLEWLRGVVDASAVLFAGDDLTDEEAFARLQPGDIGVKVGPGPTRARYRLDGPGAVPGLLRAVLDVRA
ncbi:trehalose 6-phosphate phosphatase [Zafaria cholistanensis]|uniref:Trehalose 6-phosphate phosphatase n=1 Tax=Zafaria cholistanensis TaxID=1682741 RepID=A0A5A7NTR9_9MICC|nr:trehalose-phosphatase [Zafaria cholistanensis]GER23996.1 trehalose 6-phosphate phosphatase [Zafaria cholistanensis]